MLESECVRFDNDDGDDDNLITTFYCNLKTKFSFSEFRRDNFCVCIFKFHGHFCQVLPKKL